MSQNPDNVPLGAYGELERNDRPSIVILEFYTVNQEIKGFPGQSRDVEMVRWAPKGDAKSENCWRIEHAKKDRVMWPALERAYAAWQKGQEEPVDGTPLSAFAAVNRAQADRYRLMHIRTVEDLAQIGEEVIRQVPQARSHKELAIRFLQNKPQVELAGRLAALEERLALSEQTNTELRQTLSKVEKPKPNRAAA
jgi:hypothetical protein